MYFYDAAAPPKDAHARSWWSEQPQVEEAYQLLVSKSPNEVVNIWRVAMRLGDVHPNEDLPLDELLDAAIGLLRDRNPERYRAVLLLGVRDSHPTLRSVCADQLGISLAYKADREVEQMFVGLLAHDDYEIGRESFEYLYRSLQCVPRSIAEVLELTQALAPYVIRFPES
jgi:hypothetical protein